jgi:hypothetical protein
LAHLQSISPLISCGCLGFARGISTLPAITNLHGIKQSVPSFRFANNGCFAGDPHTSPTTDLETKHRIHSPKLSCSGSAECTTQTPVNKAVTPTGKSGDKSENQELVSGLFSKINSDPDFLQMIEAWPQLPGHIKAAIKALVQTHTKETE